LFIGRVSFIIQTTANVADRGQVSETMEVRFYVDRETGLPHIYNHGVTEAEVLQVLRKPTR
jgi:hypothetical protein